MKKQERPQKYGFANEEKLQLAITWESHVDYLEREASSVDLIQRLQVARWGYKHLETFIWLYNDKEHK